MHKFKLGEQVRYIDEEGWYDFGDILEITYIEDEPNSSYYKVSLNGERSLWVQERELESI